MKKENVPNPSIIRAIQQLYQLLTKHEKFKWLYMVGLALLVSLFEVVTASVLVLFAQVLQNPMSGQEYLNRLGWVKQLAPSTIISYMAVTLGVIYLIKNIIVAIEVFFQNFSIQKMCFDFKNKLLKRYAQADYALYLTRNTSFGLQVIGSDAEQSFANGMLSVANVVSESIVFIFLVSMLVYMNPFLAIIIFFISLVLGYIIFKLLLPKFYYWGKRLQETGICTSKGLLQFFHAFKEIILLGKTSFFIENYKSYSRERSQILAIHTSVNTLPRIVIEVMFVGIFVITVMYLCIKNNSPMQMMGLLSSYLYAGFRLMPGLNRIINQLNNFKSTIPSIERIYKEYTTVAAEQIYFNVPSLKFEHAISFNNISFTYKGTSKQVLSGVDFQINKGECVGIIGKTGSGKSTITDLLLGLLRPSEGSIVIDGIYSTNSYQWQKKIGYVPQAIYLVDDTIEANIAFGEKEIDNEQLNYVIDVVQLRELIRVLSHL